MEATHKADRYTTTEDNKSSRTKLLFNFKDKCLRSLPLRNKDVRPFHVNAERITAGQNGATYRDQSADLMSCHVKLNYFQVLRCP